MQITRRDSIGVIAGGAALAVAPRVAAASEPSLNDLAKAKGLRFGSCIAANGGGSFNNPRYAALIERECGLLVPENELKWQAVRPSATSFDFAAFDRILGYATGKGLAMRGHTLLWHRSKWMPGWMETHDFGARPATAAAAMLTTHIKTVCTRYAGRIASFDVVNETVLPEDGSLAETALSTAMGGTESLVDLAFHTAREALPAAQLVYNDYMSWEAGNVLHRKGVLHLLEGFRKRGTPVDALGIQSHLVAPIPDAAQQREWRAFVDAAVAMGFKLVISEFDVRDGALPADIALRDQAVADCARAYFDMMLDYRGLRDVLVWGMVDTYSWLQNFEPRSDGAAARGNLFGADFKPVPMRAALAQAFAGAPARV